MNNSIGNFIDFVRVLLERRVIDMPDDKSGLRTLTRLLAVANKQWEEHKGDVMARWITWEKNGVQARTRIHDDETIDNPDPDGRNARMMADGWHVVRVDPIEGLHMVGGQPRNSIYHQSSND